MQRAPSCRRSPLLDEVARNLDRPPLVVDLGLVRFALQPAATEAGVAP
jgi:hypothetical protein